LIVNRRVLIFASLLALLLVSGGFTSLIASQDGAGFAIPGLLTVTSRPEASVAQFAGNQALWLLAAIAFILFNLVGATLSGMAIFWFLNREIERAKNESPAEHETLGAAFGLNRQQQAELPAEVES
jgi:hypothetical protein